MNKNKISIILPTCNRADTLRWSLQTCVDQNYDNLEIIVSDNASTDETRDVIYSFNDQRIRYINPGQRVTMVENFEFALSHVDGGYISFIGDDDGVVFDACTELNQLINEFKPEAIGGRNAIYNWPSYPTMPGTLSFDRAGQAQWIDSKKALMQVLRYKVNVYDLPVVYYGCVHHRVFQRAKSQANKFFNGVILDFYSGFAVAAVTDKYLSLKTHRPIFVVGSSKHSTGLNSTTHANKPEAKTAFTSLNYTDWQGQRDLADEMAHVYSYYVAESFAKARDAIPKSYLKDIRLDYADLMCRMMKEGQGYPPNVYNSAMNGVRQIGSKHRLQDLAESLIAKSPNNFKGITPQLPSPSRLFNYRIFIQTMDFGVKNVHEAALLCKYAQILDEHKFLNKDSQVIAGFERFLRRLYQEFGSNAWITKLINLLRK